MSSLVVKTRIQLWSKELTKRMLHGNLQKSVSESVKCKLSEDSRKEYEIKGLGDKKESQLVWAHVLEVHTLVEHYNSDPLTSKAPQSTTHKSTCL